MDEAHIQTDKMIDDLKKELDAHYSKAADEVRKKTDDFFQKYQAQDIEKQADLQSGKLSKEEYQSWQKGKIFTGKRWEDMQDTLAKDLAVTDRIAADIINNKKCDAYALNHNYGTYEIEHQTGISTSFTLYDHDTVERLIAEKPEILPKNKVNIPKDQAWNKRLLRNAVTRGVLQGESIPKIAKRMQSVTDMDKNSAIRNSRTAMTGAQNAGRADSYKRAQDLGIDVTQQWMSMLDARTRNSHRLLMGEKRKVGEKFSNGLRFPGDPEGPGYEVYNCRCTLVAKVDGYGPDVLKDAEEKITKDGETFEQWQKGHSFSKHYDETVKQWMARYAEHLKKQSFEDWMKEQTKPQVEAKPQAEKIHPNAQASLDNIKFEKSKPMTFEEADNHHVNPNYTGNNGNPFAKNCQTDTFVYECRCQGWDVQALGADEANKKVFDLQVELSWDQSKGWINKTTGQPPEKLLCNAKNSAYDITGSPKMRDWLESTVGKDGERYALSVRFKSGGRHIINMDRDADGVLRLIDNQRGPSEKHIWKGEKEIKKYLDSMSNINYVIRLDDCVPNAKFLNGITEKAKTIDKAIDIAKSTNKVDLPENLDDLLMGSHQFKGQKAEETALYLADKFHDDDDLMYEYWENYVKGKIKDSKLDEIFGFTGDQGVNFIKIDLSQLQGKTWSQVYNELKANGGSYGMLYNHLKKFDPKAEAAWQKYLAGEIDDSKIDDLLLKFYEKNPSQLTTAASTIVKTDLPDDLFNVPADLKSKFVDFADNNYKALSPTQVYEDWKAGKLKDSDIDKLFNIKSQVTVKPESQSQASVKPLTQPTVIGIDKESLKSKTASSVYSELKDKDSANANKFYYTELKKIAKKLNVKPGEAWQKYLSDELDGTDSKKIDACLEKTYGKVQAQQTPTFDKSKIPNYMMTLPSDIMQDVYDIAHKNGIAKGLTPSVYYDDYKSGKIQDAELDKIFEKKYGATQAQQSKPVAQPKMAPTTSTTTSKTPDVISIDKSKLKNKKVTEVYNELKDKDPSNANKFYYTELKKIAKSSGKKPGDVWQDYLDGKLDDANTKKIDACLEKTYGTTQTFDKSKLPKAMADMDDDTFNDVLDALHKDGLSSGDYKKWLKGKIESTSLDNYFGITQQQQQSQIQQTKTHAPTYYKDKLEKYVADFDDEIFNQFTNEYNHSGYYTTLNPQEYYEKWKSGEISNKNLDNIFHDELQAIKKSEESKSQPQTATKTTMAKTTKNVDDLGELAKTNKDLYDDAFAILKNEKGSPGTSWKKYLKGEIDNPELDKILVKHNLATDEIVEKVEKHEKLEMAQDALKKAEEDLKVAKKALKDNVDTSTKWSGIWKEDVTLDDYASKKSAIAGKKQYYQDQIKDYEDKINSGYYVHEGGKKWAEDKILEFETYIDDLDEYDQLGKYAEKYYEDIKKAEKKVKDAQDKVTKLSPVDEAYTQERKDNAKWFTKSQYYEGDKYYDALARPIHAQATSAEHRAYMEYTDASGGFNRPLAGFESPKFSGGSGWNEKYYKGVGKVPLDNEGKGSDIKHLTTFVAKSKTQDDIWVQTAQNFATLEGKNGFLGVPYGSLQSMSDAELQQFVGVQNTLGQFISGSINRGGGSYAPGNMRINIYLPRGSEALYVLEDGTFGKAEHEIILQRGGTYRVSKIYWGEDAERGGKKLMVDLELRLELGYNKYGQ